MTELQDIETAAQLAEITNSPEFQEYPPAIQQAIKDYPPFLLHRLKSTGEQGFIYSFVDNGDEILCVFDVVPAVILSSSRPVRIMGVPVTDLEKVDLGA